MKEKEEKEKEEKEQEEKEQDKKEEKEKEAAVGRRQPQETGGKLRREGRKDEGREERSKP